MNNPDLIEVVKWFKYHFIRIDTNLITIKNGKVNVAQSIEIGASGMVMDSVSKPPFKFGKVEGSFAIASYEFEDLKSLIPEEINGPFSIISPRLSLDNLEGCIPKGCTSIILRFAQIGNLKGCPDELRDNFSIFKTIIGSLEGCPQYVDNFVIDHCVLDTLEGSPREVGSTLHVQSSRLKSLKGSPREVGGDFDVRANELVDLRGMTRRIGGSILCTTNKLRTLEGAPKKVNGNFNCMNNILENLIGAPEYVEGDFMALGNPWMKSHEGAPKEVGGRLLLPTIQL